jgi:hypothetical protein
VVVLALNVFEEAALSIGLWNVVCPKYCVD